MNIKNNDVKGIKCFNLFLAQTEDLLRRSSKQTNRAMWLYRNEARKIFFMLEALSKLYAGLHSKNKFKKLRKEFKMVEDGLGEIDYYEVLFKEFINQNNIPQEVVYYIKKQSKKKSIQLNQLLVMSWRPNQIRIIKKKLSKIDWLDEQTEITGIRKYYELQIRKIITLKNSTHFHFNDLEDVHELRRKLRWLSIYALSLCGKVQLVKSTESVPEKYLTKEIITSPYNKLPDANDSKYFVLLDKNIFYALSWLIAELGKLKDNGYRIIEIKKALTENTTISETEAFEKAYKALGPTQPHVEKLLKNATDICKTFFEEVNLYKLVIGNGKINTNI